MTTLIRGGTLVTMDRDSRVFVGDLRMNGDSIADIGPKLDPLPGESVIDASNDFVIPGLIQVHTHLCQVLFRGLADDMELLDWLQKKIWPFEKAHNEKSLRAAAQVGLLEMQSLGTTTIVDMGTTTGAGFIFEEAEKAGMRFYGGNCFMDLKSASGPLYRPMEDSLREAEELISTWHRKTPLLEYVVAPRFAVSCTEKMLKASVQLQERHGLFLHTHASENPGEVDLIRKRTRMGNVDYFNKLGLLNERAVIAHGIHLSRGEVRKMVRCRAGLAHCPSSNMKLASGFAPIPEYLKSGMKIGLGSDGAPCNNTMDPFLEMRLAGLIHKPKFGPKAIPAFDAFRLATRGGAEVLNRTDIGSLSIGSKADVVLVDRSHPSVATVQDAYSALVYSCSGRDVKHVWIHGRPIVKDRKHLLLDADTILPRARSELRSLLDRARK